MLPILEFLIQRRRRETIENYVLYSEQLLSPSLFREVLNYVGDEPEQYQNDYIARTMEFNQIQHDVAILLIADLNHELGQLKHHSIHCISFRSCMPTIIGMGMEQFSRLFISLRVLLRTAFPRCPETLDIGEVHPFCERRFKLFLCLFRLKQGSTFQQMEVLLGWSASVLQEWFDLVLQILHLQLYNFHEGFLAYKGEQWQYRECLKWRYKHN